MIEARTESQLAEAMYGAPPAAAPVVPQAQAPSPPPGPTPEPARSEEQIASSMYGEKQAGVEELPPAVKALRDGDIARALYKDETAYQEVLNPALKDMALDSTAHAAELKSWSGVLSDHEVPPAEATALIQIVKTESYPEPAQTETWRNETVQALRNTYGDGAEAALKDAQLLVNRDPRLKAWFEETGLGNHPTFVLRAAATARAQIASGKLKR